MSASSIELNYPEGGTVVRVLRDAGGLVIDLTGHRDFELSFVEGDPNLDNPPRLTARGSVVDAPGGLVQFEVNRQQASNLGIGNYYAQVRWEDELAVAQRSEIFLAQLVPGLQESVDRARPVINLTSHPADVSVPNGTTSATLEGNVADESGILAITINGVSTPILNGNQFSSVEALAVGDNSFLIEAQDASGNPAWPITRIINRAGAGVTSGSPYTLDTGLFPPSLVDLGGGNYTLNAVPWIANAVNYNEDGAGNPNKVAYYYDNGGTLGVATANEQANINLTGANYTGAGLMHLASLTTGLGYKITGYTSLSLVSLQALLLAADPTATVDHYVAAILVADLDNALGLSAYRHPDHVGQAVTFAAPYANPLFGENVGGTVRTMTGQPATMGAQLYNDIAALGGSPPTESFLLYPDLTPPPNFSSQQLDPATPLDVTAQTSSPGTQIGLILCKLGIDYSTLYYSPEDDLGLILAELSAAGAEIHYYDGAIFDRVADTAWTFLAPT